jgi:hypothetical protein
MINLKEKYEEVKNDCYILSEDEANDAFEFVGKMLQLEIERLEADEPYATATMAKYEAMESELSNFLDEFRDVLECDPDSEDDDD